MSKKCNLTLSSCQHGKMTSGAKMEGSHSSSEEKKMTFGPVRMTDRQQTTDNRQTENDTYEPTVQIAQVATGGLKNGNMQWISCNFTTRARCYIPLVPQLFTVSVLIVSARSVPSRGLVRWAGVNKQMDLAFYLLSDSGSDPGKEVLVAWIVQLYSCPVVRACGLYHFAFYLVKFGIPLDPTRSSQP